VRVSGNVAEQSAQGSGVYAEFDADLQVTDNTIRNVPTGVQVNLGTSARISGNSIEGASTAIYLGPRGASAEITNNCSQQCRFALIDAGADRVSEDYNRWNAGSLIKLNGRVFDNLSSYARAGFGLHDYSAAAPDSCSQNATLRAPSAAPGA
jgi:nitrous oxidase accessory protein NosD